MHWTEVLKKTRYPDMRLITKNENVKLPSNNLTLWANHLSSEGNSNAFITAIKNGNFENKGIVKTIEFLQKYKGDYGSINREPEIGQLHLNDKNKMGEIEKRLKEIVKETLPVLKLKMQETKTTRKPTVSSSMTEEKLIQLLDNFYEKTDEEQKEIYKKLMSLSRDVIQKFYPFLRQNYGSSNPEFPNIKNDLVEEEYDKIKAITITTTSDLGSLGYEKKGAKSWVKYEKSPDKSVIYDEVVKKDESIDSKNIDIRSHPLWVMFSGQDDEKIEAMKYKIKDGFSTEDARKYLTLIRRYNFPRGVLPKGVPTDVDYNEYQQLAKLLSPLLSDTYKDYDDNLISDFLDDVKENVYLNDEALKDYYVREIYDKRDDPSYPLYVKNIKGSFNENKSKIKDLLNGELSGEYSNIKRNYNVAKKLNQSVSTSEKEVIEAFIENPDSKIALAIMKDPELKEIVSSLRDIKYTPQKYKDKDIFIVRPNSLVDEVKEFFNFNSVKLKLRRENRKIRDKRKAEGETTDTESLDDFKNNLPQVQVQDLPVLDEFQEGVEKDTALLFYTLINDEQKDFVEILTGEVNFKLELTPERILNGIVLLSTRYYDDDEDLDSLIKNISKGDFSSEDTTNEIKRFVKMLDEAIISIRKKSFDDIKEKVEEIAKNYSKYIGGKKNIIVQLINKKLIEAV